MKGAGRLCGLAVAVIIGAGFLRVGLIVLGCVLLLAFAGGIVRG